jgi:hypothetical protein
MSIWAAVPLAIWLEPSVFSWAVPEDDQDSFVRMVGFYWLALGVAGLLFRVAQLIIQDNFVVAFSWAFKIITDPFHDLVLYAKSPVYLLKGQLIDPMEHIQVNSADASQG